MLDVKPILIALNTSAHPRARAMACGPVVCTVRTRIPHCNGVLTIHSVVMQMLPSKGVSPIISEGAKNTGSSVVPAQLYVVVHLKGVDACETGMHPVKFPQEVLGTMLLFLM